MTAGGAGASLLGVSVDLSPLVLPPEMSTPEQVKKDMELSAKVIRKMDDHFGISSEATSALMSHQLDTERQLDIQILYRRPCAKFPHGAAECQRLVAQSVASNVTTDAGDSLLERSPLPVSVRQQLQHALQQAAKDGDLRKAPGRNVQSFNAVLNACMKSLGCAAAEQWFQKMRQASVTPNQASYVLIQLIQGWARAGELSLAQRCMEARRTYGTPNQGCFLAILTLCQKNRVTDAEWTLQAMVRQFPSTCLQGYTVLVDAAKLEKAEKWMRPIDEGGEATVVSYGAALDACAKFPQALKARENCSYFKVLQSMTHFGLLGDAVTFSSLLAECAKAREIKCAEHVFLLMQHRGVRPNMITYTSVARAYAICGKWQEAEKLSYSMDGSGLLINDFFLYALLLVDVLASPKQPKKAEETFLGVIRAGPIGPLPRPGASSRQGGLGSGADFKSAKSASLHGEFLPAW